MLYRLSMCIHMYIYMHIYIYFTFALSAACVRGPEENVEPHFFSRLDF